MKKLLVIPFLFTLNLFATPEAEEANDPQIIHQEALNSLTREGTIKRIKALQIANIQAQTIFRLQNIDSPTSEAFNLYDQMLEQLRTSERYSSYMTLLDRDPLVKISENISSEKFAKVSINGRPEGEKFILDVTVTKKEKSPGHIDLMGRTSIEFPKLTEALLQDLTLSFVDRDLMLGYNLSSEGINMSESQADQLMLLLQKLSEIHQQIKNPTPMKIDSNFDLSIVLSQALESLR